MVGTGRPVQAVVGAECDDDDRRPLFAERLGNAAATAGGGFSRDAGTDDAIIDAPLGQALLQQCRPGRPCRMP